jgi:protoheme IX farnesyltransferase
VIWQSAGVSLFLIPLTLVPAIVGEAGLVYSVGALILGCFFFFCSARFASRRSNAAARQLLAASIVYLPAVFILMMLNKK